MSKKWPARISNDKNAEYIAKIKPDYIQSAVVERNDLYYEHVASEWFMKLDLIVNGESSSAFLWGKGSYQPIEDMIKESGEFDCYSEVPDQIGRYTYRRKTQTKLTSKILNDLNPDNIIYAEFADFGAMGDCGSARIFTLEDGIMKFYLTGDTLKNKADEACLYEAAEFLRKLKDEHKLDYASGGFGNAVFKKPDATFYRDDDKYVFIYECNYSRYIIPASVMGVYNKVASQFALRRVETAKIETYYDENSQKLGAEASDFCEAYLAYLKRADQGRGWFDFSPTEYFDAVSYIKHQTGENVILNWYDKSRCRAALQKYKLQYISKKLGWNKLNDLFADLIESESLDIFANISAVLGEKVEDIYNKLEVRKFSDSKLAKTIKQGVSVHIYLHDFSELFSEPILVDFTSREHKKICADLLKLNGASLRSGTYGFYFANYILMKDKFSYADVLPAVTHILKTLPFDDFNCTHNEELFYFCGEIIDNSWRYVSEEKSVQKQFRDLVYDIYMPRVESLWPVIHRNEFKFKSKAGGKMFDDAVSFVMSLDDIDKRNAEIKAYLEKASKDTSDIDYLTPLGRRTFCYSLKKILKPELELKAIMTEIDPSNWYTFLSYPDTIKEAELLLTEIFNNKKTAKMDRNVRFSVLEALIITANADGVGKYILSYLHNNFQQLVDIVSTEDDEDNKNDENDKSILSDLFVAASKGISEENELEPLSQLKEDLVSYGCSEPELTQAEAYAHSLQKTIAFQRAELTPLFKK